MRFRNACSIVTEKGVRGLDVKDLIKARRVELGLSQEEVARAVGVSDATVSRWESGEIENMGRSRIVKLAQVLQITPAAIMGWEDDERPKSPFPRNGDTMALRERLRRQPGARMLLHVTEDATEDEIRQYVAVIKALRKKPYEDE